MLLVASAFVLAVNLLTAVRFWQDKRAAREGAWRVPEADLLGLALIGGSPAALIARRVLRHKTRKQPFSTRLQLIAVVQVGAAAGFGLA